MEERRGFSVRRDVVQRQLVSSTRFRGFDRGVTGLPRVNFDGRNLQKLARLGLAWLLARGRGIRAKLLVSKRKMVVPWGG